MDLAQSVTTQEVSHKWPKWENRSEQEPTVLMLQEIQPLLLEKDLLLEVLLSYLYLCMEVSCTMLIFKKVPKLV